MRAAATWETMLPVGGDDCDGDVVRTDILGAFSVGEITLSTLLGVLKDLDGHGLIIYEPDPDHLGPDGRPIYTFYSSYKNIFSTEEKVEDMEEDPPPPQDPPPPPLLIQQLAALIRPPRLCRPRDLMVQRWPAPVGVLAILELGNGNLVEDVVDLPLYLASIMLLHLNTSMWL
jgi:hypothetical protein